MNTNFGSHFITEGVNSNAPSNNSGASNNSSVGSVSQAKNNLPGSSSSGSLSSAPTKSPPPLNICIVINLLHYITPLSRLILVSEVLDNSHYGLYHSFAPTNFGSPKGQQHIPSNSVGISELERQSFVSLRTILNQLSSGRNEPINIYPFLDKFCIYLKSSFQLFDELDVSYVWDQMVRLITTAVPTLTHVFHGNILFNKPHGFYLSKGACEGIDPYICSSGIDSTKTNQSEEKDGSSDTKQLEDDITISIPNLSSFLQENTNSWTGVNSRCFQANFHSTVQSVEEILQHTAAAAASLNNNLQDGTGEAKLDTSAFNVNEKIVYNNAKILLNEPNILVFIVDSPCLPPQSLHTTPGE